MVLFLGELTERFHLLKGREVVRLAARWGVEAHGKKRHKGEGTAEWAPGGPQTQGLLGAPRCTQPPTTGTPPTWLSL